MMTAVDGSVFTAAEFNTYLRDNMDYLKTEMDGNFRALATAAGQYAVATAANTLAARGPVTSTVNNTAGTSTSLSYTATLTGGGTSPAVSITTGAIALVHFSARALNSTNGAATYTSVAVSGATTVAASDNWALLVEHDTSAADDLRYGTSHLFTGLTPGTNTFTMQYKVGSASTGGWSAREIIVEPY